MKDVRFIRLIMSEISFRLIITVINGYECNLLSRRLCPAGQEGRTGLVQFPLASFSEMSRATSEAISAKWGVVVHHQVVILLTLFCFILLIELIFLFKSLVGR